MSLLAYSSNGKANKAVTASPIPLLQYFDEHLPAKSQERIFDSSYTRARLKLSGIRCREVDAELITNNIFGMQKTGFLPLPAQVGINLPKPTPRVPGETRRSTLNSPQLVSQSR